jgi:hypothetical protein
MEQEELQASDFRARSLTPEESRILDLRMALVEKDKEIKQGNRQLAWTFVVSVVLFFLVAHWQHKVGYKEGAKSGYELGLHHNRAFNLGLKQGYLEGVKEKGDREEWMMEVIRLSECPEKVYIPPGTTVR